MSGKPHLLLAIGATLDLFVAWLLDALGVTPLAVFMAVVAAASYVLAAVLWRRTR